jgi:uncharacterized protein YndB with AHSA1/START domain
MMRGARAERRAERRQVRASRVILADPHRIFQILADPRTHAVLDGSGTVRGEPSGPDRLAPGSTFTMAMRQAGTAYRSTNRVVEYQPDRVLAWESGGYWHGRKIVGGQRWRFTMHPHRGGTLIVHAYVWGHASKPLLTVWLPGYPRRMWPAMEQTLANLAQLVEEERPWRAGSVA